MKEICQKKAKCIHGGFGILLHPGDPSANDLECSKCDYRESLRATLCGPQGIPYIVVSEDVTNAMLNGDCDDCDQDPTACATKDRCNLTNPEPKTSDIPTWDCDGRDHSDIKAKRRR